MVWPELTPARGLGAGLGLLAWLTLCVVVHWLKPRAIFAAREAR